MSKDVKGILVVRGHDFKGTIFCDGPRSVDQLTVELTSKGFFSQGIADGLGHFKSSDTSVELAHRAIWESNVYHGYLLIIYFSIPNCSSF